MSEMFDLNKRIADMTTAMTQQLMKQMTSIDFLSLMPVIDFKLPVIDISSLISALDMSVYIAGLVMPTIEWQDTLSQQIQEMTRMVDSVTQQAVANFAASAILFQETVFSGIFDDLIELIHAHKDADEAFKTSGWPIAPSMPLELRKRVVDMYKQGRTRYVSRTIMGYYQRDSHSHLVDTVETWKSHPLFSTRMHIIKDALQAHYDGRYTLSVPALLPQIEGILTEYVLANKLVAKFGKINQVYSAVIGEIDDYSLSTWAIASTLLYQLKNSTYVFTDFEKELRKSINTRKTTRHTVSHGIVPRYDRPIHSLKAFLLLDAISALQELEE